MRVLLATTVLASGLLASACTAPSPSAQLPFDTQSERASASSRTASCADQFLQGQAPHLPSKLSVETKEVCYPAYAALNSGISKTPLWSAEHLTAAEVRSARRIERTSEFYEEPSLPATQRAGLDDYRSSGFDRGHLAPSGDMPTQLDQQDSFSLANIVPQDSDLNRGLWADLERDVRDTAAAAGEAYIVTGPLFVGAQVRTINGRVFVPTHLWKAVAVPGEGSIVVVATNTAPPAFEIFTAEGFRTRYSIDPFPALSGSDRRAKLRLR